MSKQNTISVVVDETGRNCTYYYTRFFFFKREKKYKIYTTVSRWWNGHYDHHAGRWIYKPGLHEAIVLDDQHVKIV